MSFAYENLQTTNNKLFIGKEEVTMISEEEPILETDVEQNIENKLLEEVNLDKKLWQIEIPAINLVAPIKQGTSQEVMLKYVGHFEETSMWKGNVGLAAHNRRISNKLF